jgi:hypothetical protein
VVVVVDDVVLVVGCVVVVVVVDVEVDVVGAVDVVLVDDVEVEVEVEVLDEVEVLEVELDVLLVEVLDELVEVDDPDPGSHGTGAVVVVVLLHGGRTSDPNNRAPMARSPRMSPTAITHMMPAACWAAVGGQG